MVLNLPFGKKLNLDWHLVGLFPLAFGILSYAIAIAHSVNPWGLLWVCPLTAVMTGAVLLLSRNRFIISAVAAWIFNGPFWPAVTENNLQLQQFHHIVSVAVLFMILYHWKEIWNTKGFLFGVVSFYSFVIITLNLSGGIVNLLKPFEKSGPPPMWLGVVFAIIATVIFLWYKLSFKRVRKLKS